LHVGGARTALFNWLFARHNGGVFILRIEDTDKAREREEYRKEIFSALRWLGLDWDEGPDRGGDFGPYVQSERLHLYAQAKEKLEAEGRVYPCFCGVASEARAAQDDEPEESYSRAEQCECASLSPAETAKRAAARDGEPALRFRVDSSKSHQAHDLIRGVVTFPPGEIEDFIITKEGGSPLYNFACAVDDAAMQITHVIRGEEHLGNLPKQLLLHVALGNTAPQFAHLPILLNTERKKLSKRDGATALSDYRRLGYLPGALLNFLALLGWSPGNDRELLSLEEIIALFDFERVQKHGAVFDTVKLTWMNGEYLKTAAHEELVAGVRELLRREADAADLRTDSQHVGKVCELLRGRAKTLAEIVKANKYLFSRALVLHWDANAISQRAATRESRLRLADAQSVLRELRTWDRAPVEEALRALAQSQGCKAAEYIGPLRVAVTGQAVSPGIFETLEVIGRETSLGRIDAFLSVVSTPLPA